MISYRWTQHRVVDAQCNDKTGCVAINMWWVAHAAAEETLTGSPLMPAWLKLFKTHLSTQNNYWLRWRGDLAESTELRRAYSGLYGRFFARALLGHHLGFSYFCSLKRNGLNIRDKIKVGPNRWRRYPRLDRLGSTKFTPRAMRSQGKPHRQGFSFREDTQNHRYRKTTV